MDFSEDYSEAEPFGEVAVQLGYCTARDVREALNKQHKLKKKEGQEKLIGMVMLEEGILTTDQLISVLRVIEHKEAKVTQA